MRPKQSDYDSKKVRVRASETALEARNARIVTEAFDRWAAGGTTFFSDVVAPNVNWTTAAGVSETCQ